MPKVDVWKLLINADKLSIEKGNFCCLSVGVFPDNAVYWFIGGHNSYACYIDIEN